RAIRDKHGRTVGVVVVDVTLAALSDFLRKMTLAHQGFVFIVDEHGTLVAASDGPVNGEDGRRLAPSESSSVAGKAAQLLLAQNPQSAHAIDVAGAPARAIVAPLRPHRGIDWKVIAILPESEFMAAAYTAQRRGVMLASVAGLASVAVGWMLARRLSGPLERLSAHVRRVGQGDFSAQLRLQAAKELVELSNELNKMSGELRRRMELERGLALATE